MGEAARRPSKMVYLSSFRFPSQDDEWSFAMSVKLKCYDTFYPFQVLSAHHFFQASFSDITIFYGSNGSGKTTALNVMAEKIGAVRDARYNRSNFFEDYLAKCAYEESAAGRPQETRIITSDDVFDYMLNLRALNEGIDAKREDLMQEFMENKFGSFHYQTLEDYDRLKQVLLSRSKTQTQYIRHELMDNVRERSNGESAYACFTERVKDKGLYLLDEPENSLSPSHQRDLAEFLEAQARFFGCQLIIATHSPFLLAMKEARIYNLDEDPVCTCRWAQLPQVQVYQRFFQEHASEFDKFESGTPE